MLQKLGRTGFSPPSRRPSPCEQVGASRGFAWSGLWTVAALLFVTPAISRGASLDGADETDQVASAMTKEFMKGFEAVDADRDGRVPLSDLVRSLRTVGYGQVQSTGRGRGGGADPFERFEALDADGDGLLRGDEPGSYMRDHESFKDGELTLEEYTLAWEELRGRRGRGATGGGPRGNRGGGGGNRRGGGGPGGLQSADVEFLMALDANGDGQLTAAEAHDAIRSDVSEAMESRTSLDADGDGRVTPREYALSQPRTGRPVDADGLDGHARGHFQREDSNLDGVLSMAEIAARVRLSKERRFRSMQLGLRLVPSDANADGKLGFSELGFDASGAVQAGLGVTKDAPIELSKVYGKLYGAPTQVTNAIDLAIPAM